MKRRSLLTVLAISAIATAILSAIAIANNTYTWEETFEVTEPEIQCKIWIGGNRIIGCPVRIWVYLRLNGGCDCWPLCNAESEFDDGLGDSCNGVWKEWNDEWQAWKYRFECARQHPIPIHECCCHVNGTYSAHLYWWNQTSDDWEHLMDLQEDTNITLICGRYLQMYTFTPKMEGEYKVVVNFTLDSETYTFTSID